MITESLLENLFKEIDWIAARSKIIRTDVNETKNNNLKIRLKKEFKILFNRLDNIHKTSLYIFNINKNDISLSALLVEKCRRTKSEVYNSKELFFT